MTFQDATGQPLAEGDVVVFPVTFGQAIAATITKTQSGLGKPGTPEGVAAVIVTLQVPIVADPAGRIPLVKVPKQEPVVSG